MYLMHVEQGSVPVGSGRLQERLRGFLKGADEDCRDEGMREEDRMLEDERNTAGREEKEGRMIDCDVVCRPQKEEQS